MQVRANQEIELEFDPKEIATALGFKGGKVTVAEITGRKVKLTVTLPVLTKGHRKSNQKARPFQSDTEWEQNPFGSDD